MRKIKLREQNKRNLATAQQSDTIDLTHSPPSAPEVEDKPSYERVVNPDFVETDEKVKEVEKPQEVSLSPDLTNLHKQLVQTVRLKCYMMRDKNRWVRKRRNKRKYENACAEEKHNFLF